MAEDSGQTVVSTLDAHILPLVDDLVPNLERGIKVLDVGCGKGRVMAALAARFPNSEFFGFDLSVEAVSQANDYACAHDLRNLSYTTCGLTHFREEADQGQFDFITAFDAIHDQAGLQSVLDGIYV